MFKDIYDLCKQLVADVAALKGLARSERDAYRKTLDETFTLLDQALLLVIVRLGDLLHPPDPSETRPLSARLALLDNANDWMRIERDVRLCSNLRASAREMGTLWQRLSNKVTLKDPAAFGRLISGVLEGEGKLSDFIAFQLQALARLAPGADAKPQEALQQVAAVREQLLAERRDLMALQLKMFEIV